jgi:hypothetical protein
MLLILAFDVTEKSIVVGHFFFGLDYKLDEKFIFFILHFLFLGFIVLSFYKDRRNKVGYYYK